MRGITESVRWRAAAMAFAGGIALSALVARLPAAAQTIHADTANFMLPYCQREVESPHGALLGLFGSEVAYWSGRCSGIVETIWAMNDRLPPPSRSCAPKSVTRQQVMRVVVDYMQRNPAENHEAVGTLTIRALARAWPCPTGAR